MFSHLLEQTLQLDDDSSRDPLSEIEILTPEEVSVRERIFERDGALRWKGGEILGFCQVGIPLREILDRASERDRKTGSFTGTKSAEFAKLLEMFKDDGYIMSYNAPNETVLVVLKEPTSARHQLVAWMHALYFAKHGKLMLGDGKLIIEALEHSKRQLPNLIGFDIFDALGKAGWDIKTEALETRSGTRICMVNQNNKSVDHAWGGVHLHPM